MITETKWQKEGIIGEADAPELHLKEQAIFGTRISPLIDLTEPAEKLAGISHATIWWSFSETEGTEIKVWTSLDWGDWQPVTLNGRVPGINENEEYFNRILQVKVALSSKVTELEDGNIPKLSEVTLCFYDRHLRAVTYDLAQLTWKEG